MTVLMYLIPISLGLGAAALIGFMWTLRTNQYEDLEGDGERILSDRFDDRPAD